MCSFNCFGWGGEILPLTKIDHENLEADSCDTTTLLVLQGETSEAEHVQITNINNVEIIAEGNFIFFSLHISHLLVSFSKDFEVFFI